ncbi:hypothetical protein PCE1_001872 [Barthelona sp. PCE]
MAKSTQKPYGASTNATCSDEHIKAVLELWKAYIHIAKTDTKRDFTPKQENCFAAVFESHYPFRSASVAALLDPDMLSTVFTMLDSCCCFRASCHTCIESLHCVFDVIYSIAILNQNQTSAALIARFIHHVLYLLQKSAVESIYYNIDICEVTALYPSVMRCLHVLSTISSITEFLSQHISIVLLFFHHFKVPFTCGIVEYSSVLSSVALQSIFSFPTNLEKHAPKQLVSDMLGVAPFVEDMRINIVKEDESNFYYPVVAYESMEVKTLSAGTVLKLDGNSLSVYQKPKTVDESTVSGFRLRVNNTKQTDMLVPMSHSLRVFLSKYKMCNMNKYSQAVLFMTLRTKIGNDHFGGDFFSKIQLDGVLELAFIKKSQKGFVITKTDKSTSEYSCVEDVALVTFSEDLETDSDVVQSFMTASSTLSGVVFRHGLANHKMSCIINPTLIDAQHTKQLITK